jgi:hypothetical protein
VGPKTNLDMVAKWKTSFPVEYYTILTSVALEPCYIGHYHHSMVHPWVAYGGDRPQIWSAAANILNKQLQTVDRGWCSSLVVGQQADNYLLLKISLYKMLHRGLDLGRFFIIITAVGGCTGLTNSKIIKLLSQVNVFFIYYVH